MVDELLVEILCVENETWFSSMLFLQSALAFCYVSRFILFGCCARILGFLALITSRLSSNHPTAYRVHILYLPDWVCEIRRACSFIGSGWLAWNVLLQLSYRTLKRFDLLFRSINRLDNVHHPIRKQIHVWKQWAHFPNVCCCYPGLISVNSAWRTPHIQNIHTCNHTSEHLLVM